jgi:hypothetical protein
MLAVARKRTAGFIRDTPQLGRYSTTSGKPAGS